MYVVVLMYKLTQRNRNVMQNVDVIREKKLLKSFSFAIFEILIVFFWPFAGIRWIEQGVHITRHTGSTRRW